MKKIIFIFFGLSATLILVSSTYDTLSPCDSPVVGDHSGAPGETDCSGCHSSPVNPDVPNLHFEIENNNLTYVPGKTYLVRVSIKKRGHNKFGFVSTSLDTLNISKGAFSLLNTVNTRIFNSGGRKYVSHTPCGADSQDSIEWKYNWTAPSTNVGKIKLYMAMLVANHDHALTGDTTYTRVISLSPNLAGRINDKIEFERAKVFPKNFANEINIEFGSQFGNSVKQAVLFNIEGKMVGQYLTTESKMVFNTEAIGNGMYLLKIDYNNTSESVKLIKQ